MDASPAAVARRTADLLPREERRGARADRISPTPRFSGMATRYGSATSTAIREGCPVPAGARPHPTGSTTSPARWACPRGVPSGRHPRWMARPPSPGRAGWAATRRSCCRWASHHRTRTRHALQFCPDCLIEGTPYFSGRSGDSPSWSLAHGMGGHCKMRADIAVRPSCRTGRSPVDRPDATLAVTPSRDERARGRSSWCRSGHRRCKKGCCPRCWARMAECRDRGSTVRSSTWCAASSRHPRRAPFTRGSGPPSRWTIHGSWLKAGCGFEQCRLACRAPWLEMVAAWMTDWPSRFRIGADAAGLTRRSFARLHVPPSLAKEVARLPAGMRRDRRWRPVLEEPVLRRLRRVDPALYRSVRAERILGHCCHRTPTPARGDREGRQIDGTGGNGERRSGREPIVREGRQDRAGPRPRHRARQRVDAAADHEIADDRRHSDRHATGRFRAPRQGVPRRDGPRPAV